MTWNLSDFVTDDMRRDAVAKMGNFFRDIEAKNERKEILDYAKHETSFETCHLFGERHVDGTGGVMHVFHQLPLRTQSLLNEAVRTRKLRPGTIYFLVDSADQYREQGYGTGVTEQSIYLLEDALLVAHTLISRYPTKESVGATTLARAVRNAIGGVNHSRLVKDRLPLRGRMTPHQIDVAVALAYLDLDNDRTKRGYAQNYAVTSSGFKDSEGNECFGTFMLNHELGRLINKRPDTAPRVSAYLNAHHGVGSSKAAAEPVIAYVDSIAPIVLVDGWM